MIHNLEDIKKSIHGVDRTRFDRAHYIVRIDSELPIEEVLKILGSEFQPDDYLLDIRYHDLSKTVLFTTGFKVDEEESSGPRRSGHWAIGEKFINICRQMNSLKISEE